jgi:integrase
VALRRSDLDLDAASVSITRTLVEMGAGRVEWGPPKSRASKRTVAFPRALVPVFVEHLSLYAGPDPSDLVFTGPKGAVLRRSNFRAAVEWAAAVASLGRPGLHFHDLRHTGNTLASRVPGTSLRDLMDRMGHDSSRAAMIYLHGSQGADRAVADGLPVEPDGDDTAEEGHGEGTDGQTEGEPPSV